MGFRPRFKTPLSQARDTFVRYLVRPFYVFEPRTRFLVGFGALVIATMFLLLSGYSFGFAESYKEGEVVRRTIVAPADITTTDVADTEKRRAAARENSRPIFNFDSTRSATSAQSFRAAWEDLREQVQSKPGVTPVWRGEGGSAVARVIKAHRFDDAELDRLMGLMRRVTDGYIYDDSDAERLNREIVLVDVRNPAAQMIVPSPRTQMKPLTEARRNLEFELRNLPGWSHEEKAALVAALVPLIRPNLVLDQTATATARETDAKKIPETTVVLKRNQVIAREGDTVTATMLAQFSAIKGAEQSGRPWHHVIGLLLVVCAIYWSVWKFTEHQSTAATLSLSPRRAFALVGSAIVVETALMRVGFVFSDSLASQMTNAPFTEPMIWSFAVPFAAAALLVAMLVDTQLAFLTGVVTFLWHSLPWSHARQLSMALAVIGNGSQLHWPA